MKKLMYLLLGVISIASCKKASQKISENGCLSRIGITRLSGADSVIVAGLMTNNNLPATNLVFYTYQTYNALDQQNQMADFQIAEAAYLQNGLPLFFYDETYGFENGVLNGPSPLSSQTVSLDTRPTLNLQMLKDSFLVQDQRIEYNKNIAAGLKDSCLVAVFGYYNLNIDYSNEAADFVKAWYVHPQNSQWPQGYFRDDNGAVILFKPLSSNGNVP